MFPHFHYLSLKGRSIQRVLALCAPSHSQRHHRMRSCPFSDDSPVLPDIYMYDDRNVTACFPLNCSMFLSSKPPPLLLLFLHYYFTLFWSQLFLYSPPAPLLFLHLSPCPPTYKNVLTFAEYFISVSLNFNINCARPW